MSEEASLLLPFETYEENAVNIGTQQKSADMARFIDTVRDDGLYLLDVNMTDSRIRTTAEFLNKYDAPRIMVVSASNTAKDQHDYSPKQLVQMPLLADYPRFTDNPALSSRRA